MKKKAEANVYLIPGLGANGQIFDFIRLEESLEGVKRLEWIEPLDEREPLADYCKRFAEQITTPNPILIGVSFGGILAQELGKMLKARKVILISSIKSPKEMPKRLHLIRELYLYKLLPAKQLSNIEDYKKFALGKQLRKKTELYSKYMVKRSEIYLNWALYQVLHWPGLEASKVDLHLHGNKDEIFPAKHLKDFQAVQGGTHAMILTHGREIRQAILRALEA